MTERAFERLSEQIRADEEQALQFVFEETSRYCIRTLIKKTRCNMADAEDLYMDAILVFRENVLSGRLTYLSNLRTYMFGICWNLWRDLNRAQKRQQSTQEEIGRQLYLVESKLPAFLQEEEQSFKDQQILAVKTALAALSDKCRQLLQYVYIEQRPQKEIATLMGFASSNVVKVTRHRCYQQWMKRIEHAEIQPYGES